MAIALILQGLVNSEGGINSATVCVLGTLMVTGTITMMTIGIMKTGAIPALPAEWWTGLATIVTYLTIRDLHGYVTAKGAKDKPKPSNVTDSAF